MPILAAGAVAAGIDPKLIMVPAAMSASFAFMLPVATGPNAVIFGSGRLTVAQMVREGFVLNIIGAVVVSAAVIAAGRLACPENHVVCPSLAGCL